MTLPCRHSPAPRKRPTTKNVWPSVVTARPLFTLSLSLLKFQLCIFRWFVFPGSAPGCLFLFPWAFLLNQLKLPLSVIHWALWRWASLTRCCTSSYLTFNTSLFERHSLSITTLSVSDPMLHVFLFDLQHFSIWVSFTEHYDAELLWSNVIYTSCCLTLTLPYFRTSEPGKNKWVLPQNFRFVRKCTWSCGSWSFWVVLIHHAKRLNWRSVYVRPVWYALFVTKTSSQPFW